MARTPQPTPALTGAVLSIRSLFRLGRFEPARAQRDYQWERDQWADLLNDLESAFRTAGLDPGEPADPREAEKDETGAGIVTKEPVTKTAPARTLPAAQAINHYYLGHVLLLPRQSAGQFLIYDGQQRLTTLTLLLCALRDAAGGEGDWLAIQEVLRTPPPANEARLTVSTRGGALARIGAQLNGTRPPPTTAHFAPPDHRMYEAAGFFVDQLRHWSDGKRRAFADFMLDNVFATVTQMQDRRVAEYAYITINTRGKALENKDIIKGHFNQLAARQSLGAATEMSDQWAKLERAAGKRLDDILKLAFLLDYRRPAVFDFGAQLMDYFAEDSQFEDVKDWVGARLPAIVSMCQTMILDLNGKPVLTGAPASIRRMTFLPWNYWQALALRFAERDVKAPKRFEQSIAALEKWSFCINLVDVDDGKIIDIVIKALNQIDDGVDPFGPQGELRMSRSWKDRARSRLQDGQITDQKRRGAHVRWLETLYWPASAINFAATNDTSVEHVLPRGANGQWLTDFPQAIHIHTEQFGNLCLVPKAMNADIGNQQYAKKRSAFASLGAEYKSARDVAKAKTWTMAAVQARTDQLRDKALPALGLQTGTARP